MSIFQISQHFQSWFDVELVHISAWVSKDWETSYNLSEVFKNWNFCTFFKFFFSFFCVLRAISAVRAHCAPPPKANRVKELLKQKQKLSTELKFAIFVGSFMELVFQSLINHAEICTSLSKSKKYVLKVLWNSKNL